jgi:Fe-S cluster biosynthesis and repair protein YggX
MRPMKKCNLLGANKAQMEKAPYPGPVGKKIQQQCSKEAWLLWMEKQTQLINEERLNPLDPDTKKRLFEEMVNFLKIDR